MALSCSKKTISIIKTTKSKHCGDFYYLNFLHSFRTKNKLESHKKKYVNVLIPFGDTKIFEFNQYQKSDKAPFLIYADLECIMEKIHDVKIILKFHRQQK